MNKVFKSLLLTLFVFFALTLINVVMWSTRHCECPHTVTLTARHWWTA